MPTEPVGYTFNVSLSSPQAVLCRLNMLRYRSTDGRAIFPNKNARIEAGLLDVRVNDI